jgi:hypothetical protein
MHRGHDARPAAGDGVPRRNGIPLITRNPADASASCGDSVAFNVGVAQGYADLEYQWCRNGQPLEDGNAPHGTVISGAGTRTLMLDVLRQEDAGAYECTVSSACGSVTSSPAELTLCAADFNCDATLDSQDFFDFLATFFNTDPAADFNADGSVNSQDFFDLLTAFFIGC